MVVCVLLKKNYFLHSVWEGQRLWFIAFFLCSFPMLLMKPTALGAGHSPFVLSSLCLPEVLSLDLTSSTCMISSSLKRPRRGWFSCLRERGEIMYKIQGRFFFWRKEVHLMGGSAVWFSDRWEAGRVASSKTTGKGREAGKVRKLLSLSVSG